MRGAKANVGFRPIPAISEAFASYPTRELVIDFRTCLVVRVCPRKILERRSDFEQEWLFGTTLILPCQTTAVLRLNNKFPRDHGHFPTSCSD